MEIPHFDNALFLCGDGVILPRRADPGQTKPAGPRAFWSLEFGLEEQGEKTSDITCFCSSSSFCIPQAS